jgi:hypothetical protein
MKKIKAGISLFTLGSFFYNIQAQSLLDMGKVVFSIRSVNGSKSSFAPANYVSSMDNGSLPNMGEEPDHQYTEITFGGETEKDGKTVGLTCYIRIDPPGTGTFLLKKNNEKDNEFSIGIDNQIVLTGMKGQINVSHYPQKAGEFLTGTFDAILMQGTDPEAPENLYKVTGTFNIKRLE